MDNLLGAYHVGKATQTADTAITALIPPKANAKVRLTLLRYLAGTTAHTLTVLRALGSTTVSTAAAATDTTLVVASGSFVGDTLASGDYIVVRHTDGTYGQYLVSANSSGSLTINALSKAVDAGAPVWMMGEVGNSRHTQFNGTASTLVNLNDAVSGVAQSGFNDGTYSRSGYGDPLLIHSNNATAAGALEAAAASYVRY